MAAMAIHQENRYASLCRQPQGITADIGARKDVDPIDHPGHNGGQLRISLCPTSAPMRQNWLNREERIFGSS
jgi:hypothetical protein